MTESKYYTQLARLTTYEQAGQRFYAAHHKQVTIDQLVAILEPDEMAVLQEKIQNEFYDNVIDRVLEIGSESPDSTYVPKHFVKTPDTILLQQLMRYIRVSPHKHEFFELVFVLSGSVTHVIGENTFLHVPGDFTIIPPEVSHYLEAKDDSICLTASVTEDTFHRLFFDILRKNAMLSAYLDHSLRQPWFRCAVTLHAGNDTFAPDLLLRIVQQQEENRKYSKNMIELHFQVLLTHLVQNYEDTAEYLVADNAWQKKIVEILQYAYQNHMTITLERLADHFHYTPNYLSTRIKALTGHSFSSLLKDYKMGIVTHLLVNTELPVCEICKQVGYQNTSQFGRSFHNAFGMTPVQYRKQHKY